MASKKAYLLLHTIFTRGCAIDIQGFFGPLRLSGQKPARGTENGNEGHMDRQLTLRGIKQKRSEQWRRSKKSRRKCRKSRRNVALSK